MMGGRRGAVYELLRRLTALRDRYKGYRILIVDRSTASGLRGVPLEDVERVGPGSMELGDGTVIPLHRVVAVVDREGRVVWSRSSPRDRRAGGEAV